MPGTPKPHFEPFPPIIQVLEAHHTLTTFTSTKSLSIPSMHPISPRTRSVLKLFVLLSRRGVVLVVDDPFLSLSTFVTENYI